MDLISSLLLVTGLVLALIVLPIVLYALYIIYGRRKLSHIPSPPIQGFWSGHTSWVVDLRKNGKEAFGQIALDWAIKHNTDIFVLHLFHINILVVFGAENTRKMLTSKVHPKADLYKAILGFPNGQRLAGYSVGTVQGYEEWKPQRAMLDPAFHRSYLMNLVPKFNDTVDLFFRKLTQLADGKKEISLMDEFFRFSATFIANVACGMDIDVINHKHELAENISDIMHQGQALLDNPTFNLWPQNWKLANRFKQSGIKLRETGRKVILTRKAQNAAGAEPKNDILGLILASAEKSGSFDIEQLIDNWCGFFVAGQDPISATMALMMMEIGYHPEVEEKLLKEIRTVVGVGDVRAEHLPKLVYLGHVFKETLRLYPSGPATNRKISKDDMLGKYAVPKGLSVMVSFYANHRHPDYWTKPNDFYPERFEEEKYNPMLYTPFSAGPRNCIANNFSEVQAKVLLSRFLRDFKFQISPGQHGKVRQNLSVVPRDGTLGRLSLRSDKHHVHY